MNLNASVTPDIENRPDVKLSTEIVALGPDENETALLTVSVTTRTLPNYYMVTLSGVSDTLRRSIPIETKVQPYILGALSVRLMLDPEVVQTTSRKYLTAYIEPGSPMDLDHISLTTIAVNYEAGIIERLSGRVGDHDLNGIPDLAVRFNLADVASTLPGKGVNWIIITGLLTMPQGIVPEFYGYARIELRQCSFGSARTAARSRM